MADWRSAANRFVGGGPMLNMGLGLLAAGQDRRINPFAAAQQGLATGVAQMERQEDRAFRQEDRARRQRAQEAWEAAVRGIQQPNLAGPPIDILPPEMRGQPVDQLAMAQPAASPGLMGQPAGSGGPSGLMTAQSFVSSPQGQEYLAAMGPEAGGPLLFNLLNAQNKAPQRRIIEGADGYQYFADTGERVLPDVQARDPKLLSPEAQAQAIERAQAGRTTSNVNVNTGPTGIDYGKPPTDYAWARDAQGNVLLEDTGGGRMAPVAVPVVGGPAAREIAGAEEAATAAQAMEEQTANIVLDEIGRANEIIANNPRMATGMIGGVMSNLSTSDAAALERNLGTIKSNIGLNRLQEMREASPTGGALGNVTERELATLQTVYGNLDLNQRPEELQRNLNRLEMMYQGVVGGVDINGETVSMDDILYTAEQNDMTPEAVIEELRSQ